MDDVKLPDLSRIKGIGKRKKDIPPQVSANDTSNWDDRAFTAPIIGGDRDFLFKTAPLEYGFNSPYLEQERVKGDSKNIKNSE